MTMQIYPEDEPTELAKIYGEDQRGMFQGTRKSGLTPTDSLTIGGPMLHPRDWYQRRLIETAQKRKSLGFCTRELKAMRAFARFETPKLNNLTNPIHPIFQSWEASTDTMRRHTPVFPLGKGRPGYWELNNPLIHAVMLPVLRLASRFIETADVWLWWDTVAFGELKPIDKSLTDPHKGTFHSVLPRNPFVAQKERERTRKMFADLAKVLVWGMSDPIIDPRTSFSRGAEWLGLTGTDWSTGLPRCWIDLGRIEVLMQPDLPAGERLSIEHGIAKTMIHELGHAWWQFRMPNASMEPYFDNEVVSELGYSLINYMFTGRDLSLKPPGLSALASTYTYRERDRQIINFQTPYPSMYDKTKDMPILGPVDSMRFPDFFPVPIEYFERIQQEAFWEHHVPTFGAASSLRVAPLVYGRRMMSYGEAVAPDAIISEVIPLESLAEETAQAAKIENVKRLNAAAILKALEQSFEGERSQDARQLGKMITDNPNEQKFHHLRDRFTKDHIRWADVLTRIVPAVVAPPEMILEPDRFLEIADFLIRHRVILAIDTMIEPIPENAFLGHINRLGKSLGELQISGDELREFLIYVEYQKIMLHWEPTGIGLVSQRPNGWGFEPLENPEGSLVGVEMPPAAHLNIIRRHLVRYSFIYCKVRMRDIDDDYLYKLLSREPGLFSKADYQRLMTYLDASETFFIRGPPGIARCILTAEEEAHLAVVLAEAQKKHKEAIEKDIAEAKERCAKLKRRRSLISKEETESDPEWKKKRAEIMERLGPSFIRAAKQDDKQPELKKRKIDTSVKDVVAKEGGDVALPSLEKEGEKDSGSEGGGVVTRTPDKDGEKGGARGEDITENEEKKDKEEDDDIIVYSP